VLEAISLFQVKPTAVSGTKIVLIMDITFGHCSAGTDLPGADRAFRCLCRVGGDRRGNQWPKPG
jgi:hypothetical protein